MRWKTALAWLGAGSVFVSLREQGRAGFAALAGILATVAALLALWGAQADIPLLAPPLAATSVLLFAAPASPLAQPWNAVAGNVLSGLVGVACARFVPWPVMAVAAAPALAILAMFAARCLHPPGGAVALTAVLGGPAIKALGFGFVLYPIGLPTAILVVLAVVLNRATGRRYPHAAPMESAPAGPAGAVTSEDVRTVLRRHDEVVDVAPADLVDLIREVEDEAASHAPGAASCAGIMTREVPSCSPRDTAGAVLARMSRDRLAVVAVVDDRGCFLGAATPLDLAAPRPRRLGIVPAIGSFRAAPVGERMDAAWPRVSPGTSVRQAGRIMARTGRAWLPVITAAGEIEGVVTHAELLLFDAEGLAGGQALAG